MRVLSKMHGLSSRRLGWALVAFFQYATLVAGVDQTGRLDLLTGNDNLSACQLGQLIHQKCGTQSPGLDKTPIPSLCTCNNVYFNIWSACSYASGNNTLPVYSQWLDTCGGSSIDMAKSSLMTTAKDALGISVPVWGWMPIPGNTSFNLQQAVVLVHLAPKPWSVLQIVLPAAAALVAAVLTAVCFLVRRRKRDIKEYLLNLKPVPKVKPVDERQFGEWVIEQPLAIFHKDSFTPPQQQLEAYRDEVPPLPLHRHSDSTIPGHPSVPSTGLLGSVVEFDHTAQNPSVVPGGRVWPEGVIPPSPGRPYPFSLLPHQQQSRSNTKSTTPESSRKWRVQNVRMPKPWKAQPVRIREKKPGKGFRLDGSTEESTSVGQRSSRGHGDNAEDVRGSFDVRRHEDGAEDLFDEPSPMDEEPSEDEATNLMTDDQRTSYLEAGGSIEHHGRHGRLSANTGTGNSSSIDSHVRVIPPSTTSSSSPRNTMFSRPPTRYIPPPIVPPAPRQPAPAPPAIPARVPLRDVRAMNNNTTNTLNTLSILPNQLSNVIRQMTPIQEIDVRSPSPSLSSLSGITRRPSGGDVRPLPLPNSPPHGQLSFGSGVVGLTKSASASSSSVYEEHSREPSTYAHLRQDSGDSVRSVRPLPTPMHGRNPSVSSASNQRYLSPSREDLGSDYFAATGSSGQGSPYHGAHQRGLASDDSDDASFYVRSPPAQQHHILPSPPLGPPTRTMSPLGLVRSPLGGDPPVALLFPASVRGAGYRGSPGL
ncbi:hypothetical protein D9619_011585 [Psilocybe cf. subviscida]|uniref:Extracellular membrane protein CFEM domain-containing protein n=1 Tax=Psilocybe cf. subviscida TaxID=2480587 RepID=A0A8H5BSI2_9AGAR|nr:hypothetical protein D9619_011585 [Psilocybe cf. subviscida]